MRTPDQVIWDLVQEWLGKADSDLLAARVLLGAELPGYDAVAFHSQQAAEKLLKALLVRHQVEFPKTHDLGELMLLLKPFHPRLGEDLVEAEALTPHAVDSRYPGFEVVSNDEARALLELAEGVERRVRHLLGTYIEAGRPGDESAELSMGTGADDDAGADAGPT